MFYGPIGKTRWPPWLLIDWDIFDFSSETAERNSTKLDRKQDLNVLYQVCIFGPIGKTRWLPWPLIGWDIFDFSSETAERNSTKLDRKQDLNVLYKICVFRADQENKMAALASDWLKLFSISSLKLLNRIKKKLESKQDLNVLYHVCVFRADRKKQDGRPGLWFAETFSTSPLKPLNGIQQNLTGSKISTSSIKFVCFGPIRKTKWPPWPLIGWDIFDLFSETAEPNSTKLDSEQDLNVLYHVCVFRADRNNKRAALASDLLRHFRLLLWNHWTEFNETWHEARSQRPLPGLCFSSRSEKQDGRPGLWLAETFSISSLKLLNRIKQNLTVSKISMSCTMCVFFGPIGITREPPWPLICWDIFDFSSETTEQNSTKLDRKQDLNVIYQVCVLWANRKNKMAALASDWLRHFRLLLWNRWTIFNKTWQEARSQRPLPGLYFSGRSEKQDGRPGLWLAETFRLLLWNHWTEFNETWQKGRSQRSLPSLCFSDQSEKQDGCPGLWLAETFSTSPLKPLNRIKQNLTVSKISMSCTMCVFFGPIGITKEPPWPLVCWDIFDFSSETTERNSTKLDRKQDLNVLYQVCVLRANRKNKMAALASDWLRHFRLLLWNRWTEFNKTWQEARSQRPLPGLYFSGRSEKQDGRPGLWLAETFRLLLWNHWTEFNETWQKGRSQRSLPSLCFSDQSEKQDGRPGLWLAETFSTSPLKPLNRIKQNLTVSKISMSCTMCVFFGPIGITKEPPWPLVCWDIFDFSSETTERNSTKLDRKQDLNVLYQVCVLRANRKNKMAALASDWLRHFRLLLWNRWTEFNKTWQEARSQRPLPGFYFRADRKNKMAALASYWLRHFRLLLWNRWTEFNKTWQEARSQRPLQNLCFSGRSRKQDGRPGLWLAETFFDFFPETAEPN